MKHNEFNFAESFSNSSNGKTSISKWLGALIIISGLFFFAYSIFFLVNNSNFALILTQVLALIGIGSGLIFNKINRPTSIKDNSIIEENENK